MGVTHLLVNIQRVYYLNLIWTVRPLCSGYFHFSAVYILRMFTLPSADQIDRIHRRSIVKWTEKEHIRTANTTIIENLTFSASLTKYSFFMKSLQILIQTFQSRIVYNAYITVAVYELYTIFWKFTFSVVQFMYILCISNFKFLFPSVSRTYR